MANTNTERHHFIWTEEWMVSANTASIYLKAYLYISRSEMIVWMNVELVIALIFFHWNEDDDVKGSNNNAIK